MEVAEQSESPTWYSVRRYRLTASAFKGFPLRSRPDSLVKELLHLQQFKTKATEWGRVHVSVALKTYVDHQIRSGHAGLVVTKSWICGVGRTPFPGSITRCIRSWPTFSWAVWPCRNQVPLQIPWPCTWRCCMYRLLLFGDHESWYTSIATKTQPPVLLSGTGPTSYHRIKTWCDWNLSHETCKSQLLL